MSTLDMPAVSQRSWARAQAVTLALAVFALYSVFSWLQWHHYVTPSWDLGIFGQLAKAYAQGQAPIVPIKGEGFNLLGDHFHPVTVLLTPFYWLWPSPATLLYVQNGLVALSVYLLVRFAQRLLAPVAALAMGAAYALSFGVQQAVAVQFHEVAFALPLLVMSLGYLTLTRVSATPAPLLRRAVYWGAPLVFVKEDVGITVFALGLVVLWRSGWLTTGADTLFPSATTRPGPFSARLRATWRSWESTPAVAEATLLSIWGAAWSLLAIAVILPFFNTGGVFDYSDKLDVGAALGDPLGALAQLFYPWQKSATLGLLLLTGVLIWVASPLALVAVPTLLWRFLSPQEGYWEPTWHYNLILMPIIFAALLDVLARARHGQSAGHHAREYGKTGRRVAAIRKLNRRWFTTLVPAVALLLALGVLPNQPLAQLANPAFATTELSATDRMKEQAIDAIPDGSTVAADLSILTYLVPAHTVYWIGHSGDPGPDYVVIDKAGSAWGGNPPASAVDYATGRFGTAAYTHYRAIGSIDIAVRLEQ
ncbi:DUF2079 domain-containing protein [Rothia nasisuis]|uniref:DUF2079 domain-containing protein n=1 Tax=Rothia nasisuis TaxID=2109647 RepID=UPI001F3B25E0|nr:DUF2079 domain-containing protein [Rothia nasisuis]